MAALLPWKEKVLKSFECRRSNMQASCDTTVQMCQAWERSAGVTSSRLQQPLPEGPREGLELKPERTEGRIHNKQTNRLELVVTIWPELGEVCIPRTANQPWNSHVSDAQALVLSV